MECLGVSNNETFYIIYAFVLGLKIMLKFVIRIKKSNIIFWALFLYILLVGILVRSNS